MIRAFSPRRLEEALALLADRELGAVPVAGATDLMVSLHGGTLGARALVDVLRLEELRGIRRADGFLDIGAASTFSTLRDDPLVRRHAPLLAEAAATVGAWQIQNRATIGGNIGTASPAGDALPVLLALEAELDCASARGERVIPCGDVHRGYRVLALEPGELIVRIRVPIARAGMLHAFRKVGTRAAQAVSKVALAFAAQCDGRRLADVRLAAGSVAPVPLRLRSAEGACEGHALSTALADEAAARAREEVTPIDDVRSSAAYRRFVLGQLVRRALLDCLA